MLLEVKTQLGDIGFSFHSKNHGPHWYCWCGPGGEGDTEAGPDCESQAQAVLSALEAVLQYARDAHERLEELGEVVP